MTKPVGFDQKLLLHHLDFAATQATRLERSEMYDVLDNLLRADIQGAKSRKNAITMLMKIWYLVGQEQESIRDQAFEMLPYAKQEERILFHWCMVLLAYPFFKDLVKEMGLLFRMQDSIPSQVIGRKMKSLYGERRRVEVATSAVLMSIKSWGLTELLENRAYGPTARIEVDSTEMKQFIAEVLLNCGDTKIMPIDLMNHNALFFPFDYNITSGDLSGGHFELVKSIDMTMVALRN